MTGTHPGATWRSQSSERGRSREQVKVSRRRKFYIGPLVILALVIVEGLLAGRIAGQATSQDVNSPYFGPLLSVTDYLVEPYRNIHPEPELKQTGIVEFSTLVAFEGYLVIGLTLIALIQCVHIGAWFVRRRRRSRERATGRRAEIVALQTKPPPPEQEEKLAA